jgi:hypothetical protein
MNPKIKEEIKPFVRMGDINEKKIDEFVKTNYGGGIKRTGTIKDRTHWKTIDWEGKDVCVEAKSRTCKYDAFETTLIGTNKLEEFQKKVQQGKRCYLLFVFDEDGTYEWEYTPENLEKIESKTRPEFKSNDFTTFKGDKMNSYIPITDLKRVCDISSYVPDNMRKYYAKSLLTAGVCYIKLKN